MASFSTLTALDPDNGERVTALTQRIESAGYRVRVLDGSTAATPQILEEATDVLMVDLTAVDERTTGPIGASVVIAWVGETLNGLRPPAPSAAASDLRVDDLWIDTRARRAWRGHRELVLTRTEFDLLTVLARNAGTALGRQQLSRLVWNRPIDPRSKNLAVYIGYLRRKLEHDGLTRLIHTVRGFGYAMHR